MTRNSALCRSAESRSTTQTIYPLSEYQLIFRSFSKRQAATKAKISEMAVEGKLQLTALLKLNGARERSINV